MKKIITSFLILTFFSSFLVFAAARATVDSDVVSDSNSSTTLEKILSPEQIKDFKIMKKEGLTLYGIKIKKSENATGTLKIKAATEEAGSSTLAKIAGPWELSLFEKIKKIGTALWGYKKETVEHLGTINLTPEVIACFKAAIDKKDSAVKVSVTDTSAELIIALDSRNLCQKTALDLTAKAEIIKAFKVCKQDFNQVVKDSRLKAKKSRQEAWRFYKQDIYACYQSAGAAALSDADNSENSNVLMNDGGEELD
jgi:hypothetical protein